MFAVASQATAADSRGGFAIKGAGTASCAEFNSTWADSSPDLAQYGGWIEGYLTAQNMHFADTYDLAPWQSVRTLLGYLRSACEQLPPETQVVRAIDVVLRTLLPDRLETASQVERMQAGQRGVFVYTAVLGLVQQRLKDLGHWTEGDNLTESGQFAEALQAFQAAEGLEETGLPDQATLIRLLTDAG